MNDCEKYPLLLALESQEAILLYAKEEYGKLLTVLEGLPSNMAARLMAVIDQHYGCLADLLEKVMGQLERVSSQGGKHCAIDFADQDERVCVFADDSEKACDRPVFESEIDLNDLPLVNLWYH